MRHMLRSRRFALALVHFHMARKEKLGRLLVLRLLAEDAHSLLVMRLSAAHHSTNVASTCRFDRVGIGLVQLLYIVSTVTLGHGRSINRRRSVSLLSVQRLTICTHT